MTLAKFKTSLIEAESLLRSFDLLRQKGVKSLNDIGVSNEFKMASQSHDYFNAYKTGLRHFDYDFLLRDESFFQFEFKPNSNFNGFPDIRYAFFQNPQEYKTYVEFLAELNLLEGIVNIEEEIGDMFQDAYDQFLIEQQVSLRSVTIRFDTDFKNYKPLIHSVAHIHIGYNNSIRIPCDKVLTPLNFVVFVLKHTYYNIWRELIEKEDKTLLDCISSVKGSCENLENDKWEAKEKNELFIT
jgi:hypothetical protein